MPQETEGEQEAYKKQKHALKLEKAFLDKRPFANPYPSVMVFPEGTTSSDNYLLQFKAATLTLTQP